MKSPTIGTSTSTSSARRCMTDMICSFAACENVSANPRHGATYINTFPAHHHRHCFHTLHTSFSAIPVTSSNPSYQPFMVAIRPTDYPWQRLLLKRIKLCCVLIKADLHKHIQWTPCYTMIPQPVHISHYPPPPGTTHTSTWHCHPPEFEIINTN